MGNRVEVGVVAMIAMAALWYFWWPDSSKQEKPNRISKLRRGDGHVIEAFPHTERKRIGSRRGAVSNVGLSRGSTRELPPGTLGTIDMRCDGIDESTPRMKWVSETKSCCCRARVSCNWRGCPGAESICSRYPRVDAKNASVSPSCVGYELNAERRWATLKAAPSWWESHLGASKCMGLAASDRATTNADERSRLHEAWKDAWCGDYVHGEQLPSGDAHRHRRIAFDIGFHDGSDSIHFLRQGYDVIAVEANARLAASARTRPVLSRALETGQLRLIVKAIAGSAMADSTATFYVRHDGADFTSTFFVPPADAEAAKQRHKERKFDAVTVPMVTCAQLMELYGVPEYVKVDIEGADKYCFESLKPSPAAAALPRYLSSEDPGQLDTFLRLGYTQFKLVDQTVARAGYTQFSGGLPEEALSYDPDPALNNQRTGWRGEAAIREALAAQQQGLNASCAPPVNDRDAHMWGPCRVERCMYVERMRVPCTSTQRGKWRKGVNPCVIKECVPRQREYDLHAKRSL